MTAMLRSLHTDNLADLAPSWWKRATASHPHAAERLAMTAAWSGAVAAAQEPLRRPQRRLTAPGRTAVGAEGQARPVAARRRRLQRRPACHPRSLRSATGPPPGRPAPPSSSGRACRPSPGGGGGGRHVGAARPSA